MNSQKMTNCKKYNTAESVGPLSLLLTSGGMEPGTPVDIQASEDATVVLRETMTAAELVGTIQFLRTIATNAEAVDSGTECGLQRDFQARPSEPAGTRPRAGSRSRHRRYDAKVTPFYPE